MTLKSSHIFFGPLKLPYVCIIFAYISPASSHPKLNFKSSPDMKGSHKCLRAFSKMLLLLGIFLSIQQEKTKNENYIILGYSSKN